MGGVGSGRRPGRGIDWERLDPVLRELGPAEFARLGYCSRESAYRRAQRLGVRCRGRRPSVTDGVLERWVWAMERFPASAVARAAGVEQNAVVAFMERRGLGPAPLLGEFAAVMLEGAAEARAARAWGEEFHHRGTEGTEKREERGFAQGEGDNDAA